ncbi:MAG: WG repeat-containing protein [Bacilli bacterium]|nr:WG repeat-containing protein [Bacilli bacterium]
MDNKHLDDYDEDLPFSPYIDDSSTKQDNKSEEIENIFTMKNDSGLDNIEQVDINNKNIEQQENNIEKLTEGKNSYNNLVYNVDIKKNKEKKSGKIYKKIRLLPVISFLFVFGLGVYIFVNNVKADVINLIKIEENYKVGYINNDGEVIVKPKYLYGTDYYNGYAVVKNYNSLYGILNGKGNTKIAFGNIFSAVLYGDRYIVSKFTNEGLKMGILDKNLYEITRFKYDNISYLKSGIFVFNRDETMGIMNNDGKEIYTYKVDEVDDRNISIDVSNIDDDSNTDIYAKVKVNASSTIINTNTGKEVYKYTLEDINVLDNNVFYIKNEQGNNKYFIIKDDKVVFESEEYKRVRIENLNSDIAIAIKEDTTIDYINLLTKEKINSNENIKYTYSDGVILEESYNFKTDKNEYTIFTPTKTLGVFTDLNPLDDTFVNGYMKVNTSNNKYNFVNKNGEKILKKEYDFVDNFNKYGFALVQNDSEYGVINKNGKEIINTKYEEILTLDDDLFNTIKKRNKQELFIFKQNNKYGIINSSGNVVLKAIYDDFVVVTAKYPIIKAIYNNEAVIINLDTLKELTIKVTNDVQVYDNYIISSNSYYNYNGDLIYNVGG